MGQSQLEPAPGDVEAQRFSFEAFTRHEFFAEVNRWIVDRVVGPGRERIVDLGCGPGAVTKLIVERADPEAHVIGIDPSASALARAREAIRSKAAGVMQGSAEWGSGVGVGGGGADPPPTPRAEVPRQCLSADEYAALCVLAGFARPKVDLLRIEMTPESLEDIGHYSLFIEGAL